MPGGNKKVTCLNKPAAESNYKKYLHVAALKNFCLEKFLEIIIKASMADFLDFQHILLNNFRRMRFEVWEFFEAHFILYIKKNNQTTKAS